MFRRIFRVVIALTLIIWIALFMTKDSLSISLFISVATLIFLMFSFRIKGVILQTIHPPVTKGEWITFQLLM